VGLFDSMLKGLGYPNPGWAPPGGMVSGDLITRQTITDDTAFTADGFLAGIRLIAEDISSLPLILYRRLQPGKERATDHRLYGLLHDAPNAEMTSMVFRETGIGHLYTRGNWFAEKELNSYGQTVALWPLRPDRMTVERDPLTDKRVYKYRLPNGSGVILPARNVFHLPGFGWDGLVGFSRIHLMRRQLERSLATEEYGLRTYASGARPGVVIKHPGQLSKTARSHIADSWDAAYSGLTNAQRTAVLDEGMDISDFGFSPEDAQFIESARFSLEQVARGLRLAPYKLSDMSRATFNNIEESNIDHWVGALRATMVRIEQQLNKDVIAENGLFCEHLMDAVLRGKYLERMQGNQIAIQSGQLSPDEAREMDNRNPVPGGAGASFQSPLNMSPLDMLAAAVMARTQQGGTQP
jgi:HK97 family phage portal protein